MREHRPITITIAILVLFALGLATYFYLNGESNVVAVVQSGASVSKAGDLQTLAIAGVKVNFRWAPAGTFQMGSPSSENNRWDDETQHEVTLSKGFWIAETETTQELWQAVMGNNPSTFKGDKQLPVDYVSWNDCQEFVGKLNASYSSALPSGYKYAMPTEAQWEYACRAGTTTPFNFGSVLNGDKANCDGNYPYGTSTEGMYLGKATPVKSYPANAWGLYDMHGNVMEWCADWFDEDYYTSSSATTDPAGPGSGSYRVLRGGSWSFNAEYCRSADRDSDAPGLRYINCGFRLALVQDSQAQDAQTTNSTTVQNYPSDYAPEVTVKAGDLKTLTIAGVKVNFRWAPAGTFQMGSPESEEGHDSYEYETQHEVTLTKGFWIAETETTQELWQAVMGYNHSNFLGDEQLPVEEVSWDDCQEFVQKLNNTYGDALPSGYEYAMPTEAQWEYACRAGTTTPFSFGSTLNGDKANCDGRYAYGTSTEGANIEETTPVKSYEPNAWGLFDMHGNVWEWCADWYGMYGTNSSATNDPSGSEIGTYRVVRGGSWGSSAEGCRSASRFNILPYSRTCYFGFRLVLVR